MTWWLGCGLVFVGIVLGRSHKFMRAAMKGRSAMHASLLGGDQKTGVQTGVHQNVTVIAGSQVTPNAYDDAAVGADGYGLGAVGAGMVSGVVGPGPADRIYPGLVVRRGMNSYDFMADAREAEMLGDSWTASQEAEEARAFDRVREPFDGEAMRGRHA